VAKDLRGPQEEGQIPLDDLSGLLVSVQSRQELNDLEARNSSKAHSKYLLFMKPTAKFDLTYQFLFEMHKEMFGEVWSWAGEKRTSEKNLGVTPSKIGSEIHRFLFDFHQWKEKEWTPAKIAVRVHHRLVQIHPFENGNGRWARLVANTYLHRQGLPLIEWPQDEQFVRKVFKPS
jgi:Fic-DOC domain mobile mystery protein B